MGFLDNSGDIILDVVLTDLGRMLLAKGDGSFNVTKLALSDDEIDYLLQNDIKRCKQELIALSWFVDLDEVRQDAIVNLCFNLGLTRLMGFKLAMAAMAEGNYEKAAYEFYDSRWAKQVGSRADDVCHMIRTGQYPE